MPTATTDWNSVRNTAALAIEALTPEVVTASRYQTTSTERASFRAHAAASDASIFRQFDIVPAGTIFLTAEDQDVQLRETEFEIIVAYPWHWSLYDVAGLQALTKRIRNYHAMVALIEKDTNQIMEAVGRRGAANYASGQHAALEAGWRIEDGEGVSFGVIAARAIYYYDAS